MSEQELKKLEEYNVYEYKVINDENVQYNEIEKEEIIEWIKTGEIVLMNIENSENEEKLTEEKEKEEFKKNLKIGKLYEDEEKQLKALIEEFKDIIAKVQVH